MNVMGMDSSPPPVHDSSGRITINIFNDPYWSKFTSSLVQCNNDCIKSVIMRLTPNDELND